MKKEKQEFVLGLFQRGDYSCDGAGIIYSHKYGKKKPLSRRATNYGYIRHNFTLGALSPGVFAHNAVWLFFRGSIPVDMQTNHINGIKTDNRPENLELVTPKGNIQHAWALGLYKRGQDRNESKLTNKDVADIRYLLFLGKKCGFSKAKIARIFSISPYPVWSIATRRNWKHTSD